MPDITIPVPHNNGTLSNYMQSAHMCDMGDGRYLHVLQQTGPNYVFAYVTRTTNLKEGTFTSVNSPMRAVFSASSTPAAPTTARTLRLWKLSANRALLLMYRSLYVLEVLENDDVIVKAEGPANFNPSQATTMNFDGPYNLSNPAGQNGGSTLQGWSIRDNVVWFLVRNTSTQLSVDLVKVQYDPTSNSVTSTTIRRIATSTVAHATAFAKFYCQPVPGSTKKLVSVRLTPSTQTTGYTQSYTFAAAFVDGVTDTFDRFVIDSSFTQAVMTVVPLRENVVLGFPHARSYLTWNGTAWNTAQTVFSTGTGAPNILQADPLDANHFILWTMNETADIKNGTFPNLSYKVGRFVDAGFGQVSAATDFNYGKGIPLSNSFVGQAYFDQDIFMRDGSDAFVVYGRVNNNLRPNLKVFYQPGA